MSLCTSASTLLRHSCRLVVDFSVPELGMKGLELLNRATAFPVSLTSRKQSNQFGVGFVTSGHVVAPWLFPKYHNEAMEWLQYVHEEHCTYSLIMDGGAKKIVVQDIRLHKSSDIALLVPEDAYVMPDEQEVKLRENGLQDDEACTIAGYQVEVDDDREEGSRNEDECLQLPFLVSGACSARTPHQTFVITPESLNYGMCGSPVWDDSGLCVGMIEGIVPPGAPGEFKMLQGHACLIDSPEIETQLLREILDLLVKHMRDKPNPNLPICVFEQNQHSIVLFKSSAPVIISSKSAALLYTHKKISFNFTQENKQLQF